MVVTLLFYALMLVRVGEAASCSALASGVTRPPPTLPVDTVPPRNLEEAGLRAQLRTLFLESSFNLGGHRNASDIRDDINQTCHRLAVLAPPAEGECGYVFDQVSCWMRGPARMLHRQPCPRWIFYEPPGEALVSLGCAGDGKWKVNSSHHHVWNTYNTIYKPQCTLPPYPYDWLLRAARMAAAVGYALSLVATLLASFIFIYYKKLHCDRNFMHLFLFISFFLRALFYILQVAHAPQEWEPSWKCRLFMTGLRIAFASNYVWMMMEGLYIHSVIRVVFRSPNFALYTLAGWTLPFVVIAPWLYVRLFVDCSKCWVSFENPDYYWTFRGPYTIMFCVNFALFTLIMTELSRKLSQENIPERLRNRKRARAVLALMMLMGIHCFVAGIIVFVRHGMETGDSLTWTVVISVEILFNSLMGFAVSLLFCFCNSEVKNVIRQRILMWASKRQSNSSNFGKASNAGQDMSMSLLQGLRVRSQSLFEPKVETPSAWATFFHRRLLKSNTLPHAPCNSALLTKECLGLKRQTTVEETIPAQRSISASYTTGPLGL